MRNPSCQVLGIALLLYGCNEFPCLTESTSHPLETKAFSYEDRVRYTYWFEDGAQRVVFDRDEVPETAREAVLMHIDGKTDGDLHGATGWAADVSEDGGSTAHFVPMASPRATTYSAWAGSWSAGWVTTRAGVFAREIAAQQAVQAALARQPEPKEASTVDRVPKLRDELRAEGLSLDGLKLGRALRVMGARQPLPRDFGLSVDVHSAWLFVDTECAACEEATTWLSANGIKHHALLVSDPTNARTLRDLSRRAGVEKPVVPTLWHNNSLNRGFDATAWAKDLP